MINHTILCKNYSKSILFYKISLANFQVSKTELFTKAGKAERVATRLATYYICVTEYHYQPHNSLSNDYMELCVTQTQNAKYI